MSTMSSLCAFDGDFRQFLTDLDCPQLLSEITEHGEVNGNDGGLNLNKQGQNSDTCLIPVKDKKAAASSPLVSQRNVFNRSQSLPTTSLSNTSQHRINLQKRPFCDRDQLRRGGR
nr:uncharacterized protein LOC117689851 [Crassostrea gigas]